MSLSLLQRHFCKRWHGPATAAAAAKRVFLRVALWLRFVDKRDSLGNNGLHYAELVCSLHPLTRRILNMNQRLTSGQAGQEDGGNYHNQHNDSL